MTPEEKKQFTDLKEAFDKLNDLFFRTHFIDRDIFVNPMYLNGKILLKDGNSISTGATIGATIGLTGEKIGFLGHAPVAQQGAVTTPSGGATVDAESRTAIGQIKTALQNLGLTA